VVDETPDSRFTEASQALVEVDILADGREWVVVCTLGRSSLAKHVGQKSGVSSLLIGHELNQGAVLGGETGVEEGLLIKDSETIVKEIELDPFLVETEGDGLVVKVTLDHVTRETTIRTQTTGWDIRGWLSVEKLAILVVVGGGRVWWQGANRLGDGRRCLLCSGCGGSARVRAMTGGAGDLAASDRWQGGRSRRQSLNGRVWSKRRCYITGRAIGLNDVGV